MQTDNRLLDDLARIANGAFAALSGVREEAEQRLREQFEKVLARMDVVPREEFEAVKAIAVRAREEQEKLEARLAALESQLAAAPAKLAARAPKKPPAAGSEG
ncbi:MAG: accessory factor UbiK family protein [Aliidongia sp.]